MRRLHVARDHVKRPLINADQIRLGIHVPGSGNLGRQIVGGRPGECAIQRSLRPVIGGGSSGQIRDRLVNGGLEVRWRAIGQLDWFVQPLRHQRKVGGVRVPRRLH